MTDNKTPLLQVDNLTIDFLTDEKATRAVNSVSFKIARGEILGLAGESGCGKSTIAFALMGLHKPPAFISGGDVQFNGEPLDYGCETSMQKLRWKRISMVFQSAMNALNPVTTIYAQFRDTLKQHTDDNDSTIKSKTADMLQRVNIDPARMYDYPHQFSGGQRQRIVLALALVMMPDLVIMDEPTTALDVVVQREILQQIISLQKQLNFSILFITHDLGLMAQFCDRIAVMQKGHIVETATPRGIMHTAKHPYTRQLWQSVLPIHHKRGHHKRGVSP